MKILHFVHRSLYDSPAGIPLIWLCSLQTRNCQVWNLPLLLIKFLVDSLWAVSLTCVVTAEMPDRTSGASLLLPLTSKDKDSKNKEENHKLLNGNSGDPTDRVQRIFFLSFFFFFSLFFFLYYYYYYYFLFKCYHS